jgi:type IV pilus assembly protein PilY1
MSNHMKTTLLKRASASLIGLLLMTIQISIAQAASTDLATAPLANSSSSVVKPNMMFILDDSGSMNFNYMPDYIGRGTDQNRKCKTYIDLDGETRTDCNGAIDGGGTPTVGGDPPFYSYRFNGIYYNPGIRYLPPVSPCDPATNLPSMTAANTSNWTAVRTKGHDIDGSCNLDSSTTNLVSDYPESVYCSASNSSVTGNNCKRNGIDNASTDFLGAYDYPNGTSNGDFRWAKTRYGAPHYYEITPREYCKTTAMDDCQSQASATTTYPVPVYVRFCNRGISVAAANGTLANNVSCQAKFSPSGTATSNFSTPRYGNFSRVDIVSSVTSYPKSTARTDCAGTTCTYDEEMTNFANWYAYYRTRMYTMKSAAGRAFSSVDSAYRVGFITINPNDPVSSSKYLPISSFDATQKEAWFKKLYAQSSNGGTPLREALSRVGRHYAGQTDDINSGMSEDPIEYSCQQNFALLTTDGYWNGNEGVDLNDSTGIGNQDNADSGYSTRAVGAYDGNVSGASNTLADVAMYYYKNDLRTGLTNNVPTTSKDSAPHQHMTTFTLGLGLDGSLTYRPDYESATIGDFSQIKAGTKNWPRPYADDETALDDLWHAAVNGRGIYFSAKDPSSLTTGLRTSLAGVSARTGAAAASATSSPNITETDNFIFSSTYRTVFWDGEVVAQTIDTQTGNVSSTAVWSAQTQLDAQAAANTRVIYKFESADTNKREAFTWANMNATEQAYFSSKCTPEAMSQCATLDDSAKAIANNGERMVEFLRGSSTHEGNLTSLDKAFRDREHVLGDTVNATPAFVKAPRFNFTDTTAVGSEYGAFKAANLTRQGMLYIAGNDGMLHALNADTGAEVWAYIPQPVMPQMYKLADKNYGAVHQFFVDGSPQVMDIYDTTANVWKTILVGGLNGGGRGYYALDVTNPSTPKALWEFCNTGCAVNDADLGYTYGNPVIGKMPTGNANAGKWTVTVTSGYNNVSAGTGQGYLYVLNALTGAILEKVTTGVGDSTTPSGLAKISALTVNGDIDASADAIFGGDLLGNLWKFNLKTNPISVFKMSTLVNAANQAQPITTAPEIGKVPDITDYVIFVGTGKYLGASDLANTQTQSIYAIRDDNTAYSSRALTLRTITQTGTSASVTGGAVDWSLGGWFADFPESGERVNIDPQLVLGTLVVATNTPVNNACSVGGTSWIYQFNYSNGLAVSGSLGSKQQAGITVGIVIFRLPTGQLKAVSTDAGGGKTTLAIQTNPGGTQSRRTGWRELVR